MQKNLRAFLHNGKHITINTLNELNQAKQNLIKLNNAKKILEK